MPRSQEFSPFENYIKLILKTEPTGAHIYYTLDGSTPNATSHEWTQSVFVRKINVVNISAVAEHNGVVRLTLQGGGYRPERLKEGVCM